MREVIRVLGFVYIVAIIMWMLWDMTHGLEAAAAAPAVRACEAPGSFNPQLPYTPQSIVRRIRSCRTAAGTLVHFDE